MAELLRIGLSNALVAAALALVAASVGVLARRPALTHGLWLLVILKLLTPPFWAVAMPTLPRWPAPATTIKQEKAPVASDALASATPVDPTPAESLAPARSEVKSTSTANEPVGATAVLPDLAPVPISEPGPTEPASGPTAPLDAHTRSSVVLPWTAIAIGVWATGSIAWFGLTAVRTWRFGRLLRWTQPAPDDVVRLVHELAPSLGVTRIPRVRFAPGRVSPLVWVLGWRPWLILPTELWSLLDEAQRQALVAHELAHLRRGDHWVRGLEILATGLYWWHPVVWWASHELREAEEQCCDAWVVWALPRVARAYARALLDTVDFLSETPTALPVAASGMTPVRDLRRRLTMIMRGTTPRAISGAGLGGIVALAALVLPLLPTWAQPPAAPEPEWGPAERTAQIPSDDAWLDETDEGDLASLEEAQDPGPGDRDDPAQEVRALQESIRQMQEQLHRATQRLEQAQRRMNQLQERARRNEGPDQPGAGPRGRGPERPGRDAGDHERRLREVERKLDMLLGEVRALRNEMRPPHPGGPGPRPGDGPPPGGGPRPPARFAPDHPQPPALAPTPVQPAPALPPASADGSSSLAPTEVAPPTALPTPEVAPARPAPPAAPRPPRAARPAATP